MFLIVLATAFGLLIVDKLSFSLGIVLLIVLAYLCTAKCIQEIPDSDFDQDRDHPYYLSSIGRSWYKFIFSSRWYYLVKSIREILFLIKALRQAGHVRPVETLSVEEHSRELYANEPQHCGDDFSFDREIRTMVDCIMRDYIRSWYFSKISSNKDFVQDVDYVIHDTLVAFCGGVAKVDKHNFSCHVLKVYVHYFIHFREAFNKSDRDRGILQTCLTKKEQISNNFEVHHWAMKDKITEWSYLQTLIATLVESFGPVELFSCPMLHTIVVEILTQNVMYHLVNVLTSPDRINIWIAKLVQNILKLENENALILHNTNQKLNECVVSIPTISINNETDATEDVPPTQSILKPVSQVNIVENEGNDNISDLDNISTASCQTCEISLDKISGISNESEMFISDGSPDVFWHEDDVKTRGGFFLSSPPLLRAHSNTNIDQIRKDFFIGSKIYLAPNIIQMKRSKSADNIQYLPNLKKLLPLNLSNRSFRHCEKTNKSFIQLKPENSSIGDIEVAEEAIEKEIPPLFSNVKIIDTLQLEDSNNKPYTLYCIQYLGVFQNVSSDPSEPELVQQEICIRRRFREFMALQSNLEENVSLKIHLKGIKGPSKWLTTPFANLDKKNIAERKIFLESYLQALLKKDVIVRSIELQEFLAYGGDASIAYVKKATDINVPRIDKYIVRGVKGAIDLFRTALPTTLPDVASLKEQISCIEDPPVDDSNTKFQMHLIDYAKHGPEIVKFSDNFIRRFDASSSTESLYDESVPITAHKTNLKQSPLLQHNLDINDGEGCNCCNTFSITDPSLQNTLLADAVADLLFESLPHTSLFSHLLKFFPTTLFQGYLQDKLNEINKEKCTSWLHMFHKSVWPEVKLHQSQQYPNLVFTICDVLNKQFEGTRHYSQLLCGICGSDDTSECIELLIGSLQNEKLNRCLLFYIFDVIIKATCSR